MLATGEPSQRLLHQVCSQEASKALHARPACSSYKSERFQQGVPTRKQGNDQHLHMQARSPTVQRLICTIFPEGKNTKDIKLSTSAAAQAVHALSILGSSHLYCDEMDLLLQVSRPSLPFSSFPCRAKSCHEKSQACSQSALHLSQACSRKAVHWPHTFHRALYNAQAVHS